jgi:hypothetical protein
VSEIKLYILVFILGISINIILVSRLQKFRETDKYQKNQGRLYRLLRWEERMMLKFQTRFDSWFSKKKNQRIEPALLLEILLIGVWAFWIGRAYLNFDPSIIPSGREFCSTIQTHHLWTNFKECGWCAVWNGSGPGGYPAFADIYGSMLHPLVILSTVILGVVNGAKITLILCFWFAGIAQWWIAKELKLGRLPRIWSAGIAVVGGHLAGRMEQGSLGLVLSTAMASLVFGAILSVVNGKGKRASVLLGIVLASAFLSGGGYLQVGLVGTFPALLILIFDNKLQLKNVSKYFLLAFIIAGLLAAVFIIPFAHFYPNFAKYMDLEFKLAQPFKYIPLNYVIDSFEYYYSNALEKYPYPTLYTLFIGWIPVLLGIYGLTNKEKLSKSTKWFFITSILLVLSFSSGDAIKLISKIWGGATGVRHPSVLAGLTVPFILGLSAAGLDKLLRLDWPKIELKFSEDNGQQTKSIPTQWIIIIPLIFSLYQGSQFTNLWVHTYEKNPVVAPVIEELRTDSLQWVQPPFGDHIYIEPAVRLGLKISPGITFWQWKDRSLPKAFLEASYTGQPDGTSEVLTDIDTIVIYSRPEQEYASVINETQITPCQAQGTGGNLTVTCDTEYNGRLVIQENNWSGWKGWMDGKSVTILGKQWISVEVPKGKHTFIFRYRPWDVPLGIGLSLIGIILSISLWYFSTPRLDKILEDPTIIKK